MNRDLANAVHQEFARCCAALDVNPRLRTSPGHDGSAHLEQLGEVLSYVVTERGAELERRNSSDPHEVTYWFVSDLIFDIASGFELQKRVMGQSFRRLLFAKEIELMNLCNQQWAKRKEDEINAVLARHPYDDAIEG